VVTPWQAALTELLAAHQTGTFVAPSRMPLRDFVEPWLAALENQGRKPTTLRGYGTSLDAYVLPRLGDVALQELRASDLDALYAELLRSGGRRGQGLSMTTVHHVHAAMNKLLHDAERKGLVIRNVAKLANAPTLTTARAKGPGTTPIPRASVSRFLVLADAVSVDDPEVAGRIRTFESPDETVDEMIEVVASGPVAKS
jgi:hypothetical protein